MTELADIKALVVFLRSRISREARHRWMILQIHGHKAWVAGAFILLFGGNRNVEANVGIWTRGLLGWIAVFAGLLLLVATRDQSETPKQLNRQLVSLTVIGVWDVLMAAAVIASLWEYDGPWQMTPFWEASPPAPQPVPFPMVIYVALSATLWTHSRTTVGVLRSQR